MTAYSVTRTGDGGSATAMAKVTVRLGHLGAPYIADNCRRTESAK